MEKFIEVDRLVSEGQLAEAVEMLGRLIDGCKDGCGVTPGKQHEDHDKELADMYFRRGKLYWRMSLRSEAQSDYARAVALDPQSPASVALGQAREVDSFFNPDLYNP